MTPLPGKTGCLLINLGTPEAPTAGQVRTYLRQFLSDPRVIDMPAVPRWLLLNLVILPFRPRKSAEAYRQIWTDAGSPLMVHSRELVRQVQAALGPEVPVELGMRYGSPSLADALNRLRFQGVDRLVVMPLFPQYASSTTGTALAEVYRVLGTWLTMPAVQVVDPFFGHAGFLGAFGAVAAPTLSEFEPDHVLFSFHGLPERHVIRGDATLSHCLASSGCCDRLTSANQSCYRAQCFATARGLAQALDLPADRYSVSFQSRLGRTPWIKPYTDERLAELAKGGTKRLAVMCPAFTADCLETLEEIGLRARATFRAHGGEDLRLVPSLNTHPSWVAAVVDLLRPYLKANTPTTARP
ncbi:MAG TPA: ferrochelatase [Stenomitos sp.]